MKHTKKLLALLLAMLMVVTMIPMTVSATGTDTGDTTTQELDAEGWIGISTPEEFMAMSADGNYYLKNDIDFSDRSLYSSETVGNYTFNEETGDLVVEYLVNLFYGTFDGRGKSIYGFEFAYSDTSKCGVFKQLASSAPAVITNLNIGNSQNYIIANIKISKNADFNFGLLTSENGKRYFRITAENVHAYGNITVGFASDFTPSSYTKALRIGGLVGYSRETNLMNCSFNGFIDVNVAISTNVDRNIGGLVATTVYESNSGVDALRGSLFENCVNNGTISLTTLGTTAYRDRVGGIIGYTGHSTTFKNCDNNANITSAGYAGGITSIIGNDTLVVMLDCDNANTAEITDIVEGGDLYGYVDTDVPRIYARDCSAQNTPISEITMISTVDELTAVVGTGFYRLANDIDLGNKQYDNYVIDANFGGVLDGNGYKIENVNIVGTSSVASNSANTNEAAVTGFFRSIASNYLDGDDTIADGNADAAIIDLQLGTAEKPVSVTTTLTGVATGPDIGVLAAAIGADSLNKSNSVATDGATTGFAYTGMIIGVDVYGDLTHTGGKMTIGGFAGASLRAIYTDCNMYGSISVDTSANVWLNVGGFAGKATYYKNLFYNCNNFADVTLDSKDVSSDANDRRVGGFIGYNTKDVVFIGCNNFGDITADGNSTKAVAGGFVSSGSGSGTLTLVAYNCSNFGNISSNVYAAGFTANSKQEASLAFFDQYGTVTGTTSDNYYTDSTSDDYTVSKLACTTGSVDTVTANAITMVDGASVRLSEPTGLRFKANVSTSAISELKTIYGNDAVVSYGIMIAPQAFIASAGEFTHEDLDAYSTEDNGFENGDKAYVDIPVEKDESGNDKWFKGEEGAIAGSLVGIDTTLYGINFCGTAYITVTVRGEVVYVCYAQTTEENNMRTVTEVAKAALADVLYEKDGVFYTDTALQNIYTGADVADYDNKIAEETGYNVYSCYSNGEREVLDGIVNPVVAE